MLRNSPIQKGLIISDKKRYVRNPTTNARNWIGFEDFTIFPPSAEDPSYLFIWPFNSMGNAFDEQKLLEWIRINHWEENGTKTCYKEHLGSRDECLRELVGSYTTEKEIIIIPVDLTTFDVALNLRCNLVSEGVKNVLFWAIEHDTHEKLLELGHLSFHVPGITDIMF